MSTQIAREVRAQRILDANGVTIHNPIDRTFDCASERNPEKIYRVNLKESSCECMDATALFNAAHEIVKEAHTCKHILASQIFEQRIQESKPAPKPTTYAALFATFA